MCRRNHRPERTPERVQPRSSKSCPWDPKQNSNPMKYTRKQPKQMAHLKSYSITKTIYPFESTRPNGDRGLAGGRHESTLHVMASQEA